ncbi:MAG: hypothetical protein HY040_29305, partial [Planctomycetes bacterium]|nr:hypothetical protein [Planctomycetota bacterium]
MLFLFAFTLFVSAALLFLVQPMIGKMILPRLGGTPGVWNTCMVFFQGVLLVGYAYTHAVSTWNRRRQLFMQGAILVLPFVVLPFSLGAWQPPADHNPVLSVLWLLLGLVGLPFFVVATSAPLLQKWFSGTSHPAARDPYFLYGASNLGSMLALLAYPVLMEPLFPLEEQAWIWTAAYGVLVILIAGCGLVVWNAAPAGIVPAGVVPVLKPTATTIMPASNAITPWRRLRWIGLAAAPSSLMLGVTTYLTTDIAAVP